MRSTDLPAPQLNILVYPVWAADPYQKWTRHPRVHRLCRITQGQFSFIPYDHFTGKVKKAGKTWAKWDVDLLLVANPAGLEKWYRGDDLAEAVRAAVGDRSLEVHDPPEYLRSGEHPDLKGLARAARGFYAEAQGGRVARATGTTVPHRALNRPHMSNREVIRGQRRELNIGAIV